MTEASLASNTAFACVTNIFVNSIPPVFPVWVNQSSTIYFILIFQVLTKRAANRVLLNNAGTDW